MPHYSWVRIILSLLGTALISYRIGHWSGLATYGIGLVGGIVFGIRMYFNFGDVRE